MSLPPIDRILPQHLEYLKTRFNIIDEFALIEVDQDWDRFQLRLRCLGQEFQPNDRILITHCDVDYYEPTIPHGLALRNLLHAFRSADIPRYLMFLWTNHWGLQREVDLLCANDAIEDRPTVFESFLLNNIYRPGTWYDVDVNHDAIQRHAITMMWKGRSHRHAALNHLRDLGEKIAVANWHNYT